MRNPFLVVSLCLVAVATGSGSVKLPEAAPIHYRLSIRVDPATSLFEASVDVSNLRADGPVEFLLGRTLDITASSPAVDRVPLGDTDPFFGNNGTSGALDQRRVARYRTHGPVTGTLTVAYRGRIDFGLSNQKEEYSRGFRETLGLVAREGLYLSGASFWYPHVGSELVTFDLQAHLPDGWHLISQGDGTSRDDAGVARWRTSAPMDEIYLVGGPLRVWRDRAGAVDTMVFLHDDDAGLATKYLGATAQYLEMYRGLIGPYPYSKFALVENFWETGYGMPSFTLLGPSIVRFPFILTSSYPHEILHNWWGNSVFVDYERGNWSEGLTAYLADHLIQEQQGKGADYRHATLQKYASYVRAGRDFPLAEFRSRESAATEAVGYGKTLMGLHMLRLRMGDDGFRTLLARFYREFQGKRASFGDLQHVAEAVAGGPLERFFDDLIARPGAPVLEVNARATSDGRGYVVRGAVRQTQAAPPFAFDVPVVVQTADRTLTTMVTFAGREAAFEIASPGEPLAVHVDPAFDMFRALDAREIPPSIGQIFGEPRITAVLPSGATPAEREAWKALVKGWETENHLIDVVSDRELPQVPSDRAVWILGRTNTLAARLFGADQRVDLGPSALSVDGQAIPLSRHSAVVVRRHPSAPQTAIGWIINDVPAAFAGLGRKLPHYGRYSYLGFEGDEPVNTVKGEWPTTDSPLSLDLRAAAAGGTRLPALALDARAALVDPAPTFSQSALAAHVGWLAAPEREGRGIGSDGLQQAASYVAEHFKAAGLEPGGDNGSWFQTVPVADGPGGRPATGVNVIGYLAGARGEWHGQSALVSAHYDHLGRGWPSAHTGDANTIHPGADDNASGVAVLLELARVLASAGPPQRAIVFVAFTGEEAGLLGARAFADHASPFPLAQTIGVVNLDTVGRLGTGTLAVLGAGTATEWPHIFRGAGFVTGVESTSVAGNAEASDQRVFIERGIPAVQLFTGPHADYHRPGDTPDKVDAAGLVKVAAVAREAVAYLAERPTALTATIGGQTSTPPPPASSPAGGIERRVTFGAVPDFAYAGVGVKLIDTSSGSPAAAAGLRAGDVITALDGTAIASLQQFATVLRGLAPGQRITVTFTRDGVERTVDLVVVAR